MITHPEAMVSAATQLATIGSDLSAAHLVAVAPTTALIPAAADEVSAGITQLFSSYAEDFHGLAAKAAAFQGQFVGNLKASAASYTAADTAPVPWLQGWKSTLEWGWNTTGENLQHILGQIEQSALVQAIGGIALLVAFYAGFFGLFLVLVPLGILAQAIQGFIQQLGSLLP